MISSGCKDFDSFLGNGFERKLLCLIYGPSASGKTTLCLQTALEVAKRGEKVLFVDTENGFSIERLKQMNPSEGLDLSNIVVMKIKDYISQVNFFEKLDDILSSGGFSLLIIDTIGMQYRKALQDSNHQYVNESMINILRKLKHAAEDHNIPIIMTNQVYNNFEGDTISIGGNMIKRFGKYLIELKNKPRRAVLLKPEGKVFHFKIEDEGIKKIF